MGERAQETDVKAIAIWFRWEVGRADLTPPAAMLARRMVVLIGICRCH